MKDGLRHLSELQMLLQAAPSAAPSAQPKTPPMLLASEGPLQPGRVQELQKPSPIPETRTANANSKFCRMPLALIIFKVQTFVWIKCKVGPQQNYFKVTTPCLYACMTSCVHTAVVHTTPQILTNHTVEAHLKAF